MSKLLHKLEKSSFLRNLFLSLLALVLVITVLLTSVLLTSYYSSTHKLTNRYFGNLLKQCNYSITYMNDLAQRLSSSLINDHRVVTFLNMDRPDNLQTTVTHQVVQSIILPLSYVDSVYLYNQNLDLMLCTKSGVQNGLDSFYDTDVVQRLQALQADQTASNSPLAHSVSYRGSIPVSIYSYIVPNFDRSGELTSALIINISVDVLTQSLRELNANNSNARYAVTDPNGALLVTPFQDTDANQDFAEMAARYAAAGAGEGEDTVKIDGTKYLMAFTTSNSNGWYIYAVVPETVIYGDVTATAVTSVIIILCLLALFACAALYLARRASHPVEVINQIAQGEEAAEAELDAFHTEEFRSIAAAFQRIRQENDEFSKYKDATSRIVRKEFLESLFCGTAVYAPEQYQVHLEELGCQWLLDQPLVMCLICIDNYMDFSQQNNLREREALRFAIVNVSTELLEQHFRCEMVEHSYDRFIAVLTYAEMPASEAAAKLEETLSEIIALLNKHLQISLTAAHGTTFRGIGHMAQVYENLEELLQLRVRRGYGTVLTPQMAEDLDQEDFQVSSAAENILTDYVVNGNGQQAVAQFEVIAKDLFRFSPSEILPYLLHLAYRLLNSVKEADSSVSSQATEEFKKVASRLPQCEIESDYQRHFTIYLERLCAILTAQKAAQEGQNSNILVRRMLKIIEANYSQEELCLNSIADELGLSTHYVGQIFRADQNKSVSKYILDLRLEKMAQALRETDRPFSQIMEAAGFEEKQKNYVYTLFKKHFGVTVKAYRQQYSSNETALQS